MCTVFFFNVTVTFYDDITTMSDICVMAVSRLRGGGGHGQIVSDVLWRNSLCTERGWGGIVMEQQSMAESKGEDDIIPLYSVIGRNIAVFLHAI